MNAKRTDREELVSLRISVARVAQALGQIDPVSYIKVEDLAFSELHELASTRDRGWNDLCYYMVQRALELNSEVERLTVAPPDEFDK